VKPVKKVAIKREVMLDDKPASCPRCGASKLWVAARMSRVVFDLKFSRGGINRWVVRYRYNSYRCVACKAQMTLRPRETKYGQNLRAYVAYLLIEMRLSHQKIREHVATVFKLQITNTMVNDMKALMAKKYEPTYRRILEQIASGSLVHADETKGVVYGGGHYVWIFANLTSVAYVYSASREASWREEQARYLREIERHQAANKSYMDEGVRLLELARNARRLFERQEPREKRRLLNFLVSNCSCKSGELTVTLRQPFDLLAETTLALEKKKAVGDTAGGPSQIWLPFLDTYRTMCLVPKPEFRRLLEQARDLPIAA
jgi:hypothetical protein